MSISIAAFRAAVTAREEEQASQRGKRLDLEAQASKYAAGIISYLGDNTGRAFAAEEIATAIGATDWYEAERLHQKNPFAVYSPLFPAGLTFSPQVPSFSYCLGRAQDLCRDIHSESIDGVSYYCYQPNEVPAEAKT